jgi:hypothetical protein
MLLPAQATKISTNYRVLSAIGTTEAYSNLIINTLKSLLKVQDSFLDN